MRSGEMPVRTSTRQDSAPGEWGPSLKQGQGMAPRSPSHDPRPVSQSPMPWPPHYSSAMEGNYGPILRLLFGAFFKRIRPLSDQVRRVQELSRQGTIVYVLKARSNLESLLYHYQSRLHGLPVPVFACDSDMSLFQSIGFFLRAQRSRITAVRGGLRRRGPYETGYIRELVRSGHPIILYLQDMEAFTRRFLRLGLDPFLEVLEAQRQHRDRIFMIPQMVIWDRSLERRYPRLDEILFGSRSNPSRLRVLFNFLRFYRRDSCITQAEPLDLKEFLDANAEKGPQEVALRLREELLRRLQEQRRLVVGPVALSRQEVMERVLFDEKVQEAIGRRAKRRGRPVEAVRKEAYHILSEIAADLDPFFVRLWDRVMNWALRNLYDGLEVDQEGLGKVRQAALRSNIVLVPCHKSHMDYLILAYVFYHNNLFPPLIAAGLNLAFWPMGFIFRKSGAFFIRRDFRGSTLYPAMFTRYLHLLLREGYPLEFFIEGGRSRSGKLTLPKLGFLSLLIEGYRGGACEDISFVPVAISYERVMEEGAYLREVEGEEKPRESFWGMVRSRKAIHKRYGKIYIVFNEPVSLKGYLARTLENPSSPIRYTRHNISQYLASDLARQINQVTVVVPTALAASAILSSSKRGFTYGEVLRCAILFYAFLQDEGARLSSSLSRAENVPMTLRETLELLQKERLIHRVRVGREADDEDREDSIFEVQERNRRALDYHKNSILHYFIPGAFVSVSLLSAGSSVVSMERLLDDVSFLKDFFQQEFVFPHEEDLEARTRQTLERMMARNLVRGVNGGFSVPSGRRQDLLLLARLLQSYFESYFVVGSSLKAIASRRLSQRIFMWRVRFTGYRFYQTGKIQLPESLSHVNYANAIQYLVDQKIIMRQVDKSFVEGVYFSLNRERRKIHWRRLKSFLRVYT